VTATHQALVVERHLERDVSEASSISTQKGFALRAASGPSGRPFGLRAGGLERS